MASQLSTLRSGIKGMKGFRDRELPVGRRMILSKKIFWGGEQPDNQRPFVRGNACRWGNEMLVMPQIKERRTAPYREIAHARRGRRE